MIADESRVQKNSGPGNPAVQTLRPGKRKPAGIKILIGLLIGLFAFYLFSILPPGGLSQKAAVLTDVESAAPPKETQAVVTAETSPAAIKEGAYITTDKPYTFIWMSDTQGLAEYYPQIYTTTTQWVVDNIQKLNIQYLIHTGDFVNTNSDPVQWDNAKKAIGILNGKLPYLTVAGNHDIYDGADQYDVYDNYLDMVNAANFKALPMFGGFYQDGRGRYDLLTINNDSYIILSMGYDIDNDAIEWMNKILRQYESRTAILCVHGYMDETGDLTSDGDKLYSEVVVPNKNIRLVLCGHRHGVNHFTATPDEGGNRKVYELLFNYQDETDAGSGYLAIMTFDDTKREINITSYSPYLDDYVYFEDNPGLEEFSIPMDFS